MNDDSGRMSRGGERVYVGRWDMYRSQTGNGLCICGYNSTTGELQAIKSIAPHITVGAVCVDAKRNILYCTNESRTLPGFFLGGGGTVHAFAIDSATGDLTEINQRPSFGSLPCALAIDPEGKYLIVAHHTDKAPITRIGQEPSGKYRISVDYDDATTVLFPLAADGAIGGPCDIHMHHGSGGPLAKQTHPQLHSVTASPSGKLFIVCDKGNDQLVVFRIDDRQDKLEVCGTVRTAPGSSPRYCAFHPDLPFVFVNHETMAIVTSYRYDTAGQLEPICTANALPDDYEDDPVMHQSDIKVHPSGQFLYSMIRHINAISTFAIDTATGSINKIQTLTLEGTGPRGCAIAPDGRFMLVAALTSNEILILAIGQDGKLTSSGRKISQPNPGSITFW